jgi:hypothetical protein
MGRLKTENSKKCFSILREFIDDSPLMGSQKQRAALALEQLQKITAGTGSLDSSNAGDSTGESGSACISRPRADGST